MAKPSIPFRIHYADGVKLTVNAPDANAARKAGEALHEAHITKIKIIKEAGDAS